MRADGDRIAAEVGQSRLVPDHKTIADIRKDNGRGLRQVCARFVEL